MTTPIIPPEHLPIDGEEWYGCVYPERPYRPVVTRYMSWCRSCWLAAEAAMHNGFADDTRQMTLGEWVERHRGKHQVNA